MERDVERLLEGVRGFVESLHAQSQAQTETLVQFDRRLSALERLLDPLPPGLDGAHVEALGDSVAHLRAENGLLQERLRAQGGRIDALEDGLKVLDGWATDQGARVDSLDRRLESVVVTMANMNGGEFDGE